MMKKNFKTIAEITEREYVTKYSKLDDYSSYKRDKVSIYVVKLITTYDLYVMGVFVKSCTDEKIVPFSFLSLEAAKDFCSVCPNIKKDTLTGPDSTFSDFGVFYRTYKLSKNDNVVYVVWDLRSLLIVHEESFKFFPIKQYPAIKGYAKDIKLKKWSCTYSENDIKYTNFNTNLSELMQTPSKESGVLNTWRYELVAQ